MNREARVAQRPTFLLQNPTFRGLTVEQRGGLAPRISFTCARLEARNMPSLTRVGYERNSSLITDAGADLQWHNRVLDQTRGVGERHREREQGQQLHVPTSLLSANRPRGSSYGSICQACNKEWFTIRIVEDPRGLKGLKFPSRIFGNLIGSDLRTVGRASEPGSRRS